MPIICYGLYTTELKCLMPLYTRRRLATRTVILYRQWILNTVSGHKIKMCSSSKRPSLCSACKWNITRNKTDPQKGLPASPLTQHSLIHRLLARSFDLASCACWRYYVFFKSVLLSFKIHISSFSLQQFHTFHFLGNIKTWELKTTPL